MAADYAVRFRTLAAQCGWNDTSLSFFMRVCHDTETSLAQYITMAIRLDNLMYQQLISRASQPVSHYGLDLHPPREGKGGRQMENGLLHHPGALRVSSDVIRINQCFSCLPIFHQ